MIYLAVLLVSFLAGEAAAANYELVAPTLWLNSTTAALTSSARTTGDATVVVTDNTDRAYIRPLSATNSLKMEVTVPGTISSEWAFDWTISETLTDLSRFSFAYWTTITSSSTWSVEVRLSENSGYTARYNYLPIAVAPNEIRGGWNLVTHDRATPFSTTGSPDPGNTFVRVRLRVIIPAGETGVWYFSPFYKNGSNRPKIAFSFDDAYTTQYTVAYQNLQARGMPASMNVRTSGIQLSDGQLQTLQDAGWSFHTLAGGTGDLTSLSVAAALTEVQTAQAYLNTRGLVSGRKTITFPAGGTNDALDAGLQTIGYANGAITGGRVTKYWDGLAQPMRISRISMSSVSLANLKAAVDQAVTFGCGAVFYVHDIQNPSTEYTNFMALLEYVAARRDAGLLDVVSVQMMIDGLNGATAIVRRPVRQ